MKVPKAARRRFKTSSPPSDAEDETDLTPSLLLIGDDGRRRRRCSRSLSVECGKCGQLERKRRFVRWSVRPSAWKIWRACSCVLTSLESWSCQSRRPASVLWPATRGRAQLKMGSAGGPTAFLSAAASKLFLTRARYSRPLMISNSRISGS